MSPTAHPTTSLATRLAAAPDAAAARAIVWAALDSGEWWAQGIRALEDAIAAIPRFDDALVVLLAATEEVPVLEAAPRLTRAQRARLTHALECRAMAPDGDRPTSWAAALLADEQARHAVATSSHAAPSAEPPVVFDVLWRLAVPPRPRAGEEPSFRARAARAVVDLPGRLTEVQLIQLLAAYVDVSGDPSGVIATLCQHASVGPAFLNCVLAVVEGTWPRSEGSTALALVPDSTRLRLARYLATHPAVHASPTWRARWWRALAPRGSHTGPWAWYHPAAIRVAAASDPLLTMAADPQAPDRYLALQTWVMAVGRAGGWPRELADLEPAIDQDLATIMLQSENAEVRQVGLTALARAPIPTASAAPWRAAPPPADAAIWPLLIPAVRERLAHHPDDVASWNAHLQAGPSSVAALLAAVSGDLSTVGARIVDDAARDATRMARALQMARGHLATIVPEDAVPVSGADTRARPTRSRR